MGEMKKQRSEAPTLILRLAV